MSDYARDGLDLDDDDRLPWLEPADDSYEEEGVSPLKLLLFLLAGLALVAAVVFGIWWVKERQAGAGGEGRLIAAPSGSYKIPAPEADAKAIQGEGDTSFAASEGVAQDGKIDASRLPEAPVTSGAAPAETPKPQTAKPTNSLKAPVADATGPAKKPVEAAEPVKASGPMIQLGAYGSKAIANDAWAKLSKRFAYLAPLGTSIEEAKVGGNTYFRLRARVANASDANALCGKLKVAGESCIVVR